MARGLERAIKTALALIMLVVPFQHIYAATQEQIDSLKRKLATLPSQPTHFYNNPKEDATTYFFDLNAQTTLFYQVSEDSAGKELIGIDLSETKVIPPGFFVRTMLSTTCQPESVFYQYIPASQSTRRHAEGFSGVSSTQNMQYRKPNKKDSIDFDNTIDAALEKLENSKNNY